MWTSLSNKLSGIKTSLNFCISAIVGERLVCYTVADDIRSPPLNDRFTGLVLTNDDSAPGGQRGILIKEVERPQEETH